MCKQLVVYHTSLATTT